MSVFRGLGVMGNTKEKKVTFIGSKTITSQATTNAQTLTWANANLGNERGSNTKLVLFINKNTGGFAGRQYNIKLGGASTTTLFPGDQNSSSYITHPGNQTANITFTCQHNIAIAYYYELYLYAITDAYNSGPEEFLDGSQTLTPTIESNGTVVIAMTSASAENTAQYGIATLDKTGQRIKIYSHINPNSGNRNYTTGANTEAAHSLLYWN